MPDLEEIKSHPNVVGCFKNLPFYNIHMKKLNVKCLENINLLYELPFYEELNVIKTDHACRGYAISYKIELVRKKRSR